MEMCKEAGMAVSACLFKVTRYSYLHFVAALTEGDCGLQELLDNIIIFAQL